MILGSGLGVLAEDVEDAVAIDYKDIPHFPLSTVEGDSGKMVSSRLTGNNIISLQGRFHYYEVYVM